MYSVIKLNFKVHGYTVQYIKWAFKCYFSHWFGDGISWKKRTSFEKRLIVSNKKDRVTIVLLSILQAPLEPVQLLCKYCHFYNKAALLKQASFILILAPLNVYTHWLGNNEPKKKKLQISSDNCTQRKEKLHYGGIVYYTPSKGQTVASCLKSKRRFWLYFSHTILYFTSCPALISQWIQNYFTSFLKAQGKEKRP